MQNLISIYFIIITTAYLFHTIPLECLLGNLNNENNSLLLKNKQIFKRKLKLTNFVLDVRNGLKLHRGSSKLNQT